MDTQMYTSLEDYLKVLKDQGFQEVLKVPFIGNRWYAMKWHQQDETYFIYWRDPVLVAFDSHEGRLVNGGFVYYNWLPRQKPTFYIESGYWKNDVLIGMHDCRVDFIHKIKMLGEAGTLISPWIEYKKLWLVNYIERYESKDHVLVTKDRISKLPQEVQRCIEKWNGEEVQTNQVTLSNTKD